MITVMKKQITVVEGDFSDALSLNHRNQRTSLLLRTRCNQFTKTIEGQSMAEYVTLISVVLVALLAMQIYMKRGIQAVIKCSTDQFGNQDYEERDPAKGMISNSISDTITSGQSRVQQVSSDYGVESTYTTNESAVSIGGYRASKTENITL